VASSSLPVCTVSPVASRTKKPLEVRPASVTVTSRTCTVS
jgi:hypothetical protein